MQVLRYPAPGGAASRVLLVMLPGVGIEAEAFARHGMVAAVRDRGLAVDILAARPELDLYLDGTVAQWLHTEIIQPARDQGHARIWLLGISLGGMGALLHASAQAEVLEGIILLAPFLGTPGTIAELERAGSLAAWSAADSAAVAPEKTLLAWLQGYTAHLPYRPKLYLGFGAADRFAAGHRLLAAALPQAQVVTEAGGHDWPTWLALWQRVLDRAPFTANTGADA